MLYYIIHLIFNCSILKRYIDDCFIMCFFVVNSVCSIDYFMNDDNDVRLLVDII